MHIERTLQGKDTDAQTDLFAAHFVVPGLTAGPFGAAAGATGAGGIAGGSELRVGVGWRLPCRSWNDFCSSARRSPIRELPSCPNCALICGSFSSRAAPAGVL